MNTIHNPKTIHPPVGDIYSHGAEVSPNSRLLWVAGEVGITPAGDVVKGFEAQTRTAWQNIAEVLNSAGMRAACKTLSDSDRRKTAQVSAHSGAGQLSRF